jgi:hypothetical protein
MKQKLSGLDRISIPIILEKANIEGSETEMITLKEVKKDLLKKIQMNDSDLAFYGIQPRPGGGISWNTSNMEQEKDYDLTNPEIALLKQAREAMNRAKRITEQVLTTCLKIKEMKLPEDTKPEK